MDNNLIMIILMVFLIILIFICLDLRNELERKDKRLRITEDKNIELHAKNTMLELMLKMKKIEEETENERNDS